MRRLFLSAVLAIVAGCAQQAKDAPVSLEQVPEEFVKTAKDQLPEVRFEQAIKRGDGSYEIRGRDKQGKVRDVELNAKGEVTEIE